MTEIKPYSEREQNFIRQNAGIMSWSEIANNLNKQYPEDNAGKRTRSGVVAWNAQDQNPMVRRLVLVPKKLLEQAGDPDLSEFICKGLSNRVKRQQETKAG